MFIWENFAAACQDRTVAPRLDIVAKVPDGVDLSSFMRGAEVAVGLMTPWILERIETHEPGDITMEMVRRAVPEAATEKTGDSWYLHIGGERFRVIVLQFHFKKGGVRGHADLAPLSETDLWNPPGGFKLRRTEVL